MNQIALPRGFRSAIAARTSWERDPIVYLTPLILIGLGIVAYRISYAVFTQVVQPGYERVLIEFLLKPDAPEWLVSVARNIIFFIVLTFSKLAIYLPLFILSKRFFPFPRVRKGPSWEWMAIALFGVELSCEILSLYVLDGSGCRFADEARDLFDSHLTALGLIALHAVPLVGSPVVEEVIYRGFFFQLFAVRHVIFRLAATSLLFTYSHLVNSTGQLLSWEFVTSTELMRQVFTSWLPGGVVLGFAREASGGLAMPILMHMIYNTMYVVVGIALVSFGVC